jgi:plastocyanin
MRIKAHWQSPFACACNTLCALLLLTSLSTGSLLHADQDSTDIIKMEMGGYRFMPHEIRLTANKPAVLRLVNTDKTIPHNFTLKIAGSNIDINIDVSGGESAEVHLPALPAGSYSFYCGSKMVFSESHRDKGMEGTLVVSPE